MNISRSTHTSIIQAFNIKSIDRNANQEFQVNRFVDRHSVIVLPPLLQTRQRWRALACSCAVAALVRSFPLTTRYVTKMLPFDGISFFRCNDIVIKTRTNRNKTRLFLTIRHPRSWCLISWQDRIAAIYDLSVAYPDVPITETVADVVGAGTATARSQYYGSANNRSLWLGGMFDYRGLSDYTPIQDKAWYSITASEAAESLPRMGTRAPFPCAEFHKTQTLKLSKGLTSRQRGRSMTPLEEHPIQ